MTFKQKFFKAIDKKIKKECIRQGVKKLNQWDEDKLHAEVSEHIIKRLLQDDGYTVIKVPHEKYPYDLICKKDNQIISVEAKSCGCRQAFFETASVKTGIPPEYLRESELVTHVVRLNWQDGKTYMIDNKKLSHFVNTCGYTQIINDQKTAYGITLDVTSPTIGFIRRLS
jgi:hypothetical protein